MADRGSDSVWTEAETVAVTVTGTDGQDRTNNRSDRNSKDNKITGDCVGTADARDPTRETQRVVIRSVSIL